MSTASTVLPQLWLLAATLQLLVGMPLLGRACRSLLKALREVLQTYAAIAASENERLSARITLLEDRLARQEMRNLP